MIEDEKKREALVLIDPETHYQTLKGWGTSLCWWGNIIGTWDDGAGRTVRESVARLAFSPEYLNLNLFRFNVGGGDKTDSSILRAEGRVPGWSVDMTGHPDGTGTYDETQFLKKPAEKMADSGQIWMWEKANEYRSELAKTTGKNDAVNEVFINSPPYYMTISGSSTGADGGGNNLRPECRDDFAAYLWRAVKWLDCDLEKLGFKQSGAKIDMIEPMNEPSVGFWKNGSTKQEGCAFLGAEEQNALLEAVRNSDCRLEGVGLTFADESALKQTVSSYKELAEENRLTLASISTHTYEEENDSRYRLRDLAWGEDKELWMSEVCFDGGEINSPQYFGVSVDLVRGILNDLKKMQSEAWVIWLVADSFYEALKWGGHWGLLEAVFETDGRPVKGYHYDALEPGAKQLIPGTVVSGIQIPEDDRFAQKVIVTKQFYTLMNFSKFLKASYVLIDITDEDMVAAISPDGKELVVVAANLEECDRIVRFDMQRFPNASKVRTYQTNKELDCREIDGTELADGVLCAVLPANSVTTFVVTSLNYLYNKKNYEKEYRVFVNAAARYCSGVSRAEKNKFKYSGKWDSVVSAALYSGENMQTSVEKSEVSFLTDGNRVVLFGTAESCFGVRIDGEEMSCHTIDRESQQKKVLFDSGMFFDGNVHKIELICLGGTLTIDCAEVIYGSVDAI